MHKFFMGLAKLMAILGGALLTVLIVLICLSVLGRSLNTILHGPLFDGALSGLGDWLLALGIGPINGDFELVEAGIAFSIFAFLPLCQISAGHASVDIFTNWLPRRANQVLGMVIEIVFAIVLVLIAMQLKEGMDSKIRSGTTTFLLEFPIWWAYALSLFGAVAAAIVGVYMACVRTYEALTGRIVVDVAGGAGH